MESKRKCGKLTARDMQIAALLGSGLTYSEAGKRLKLSERTIARAMERPQVRAEVDAIRERAVEAGLGILCDEFTKAINDLRKLREKGTPKDAVKLGAVKLTIESVLKVRENVTLAREVAELREMLNEPAGGSEPPKEDRGQPPDKPSGSGEPERIEERPDGGSESNGNEARPLAEQVADEWLGTGFIAGVKASGQV